MIRYRNDFHISLPDDVKAFVEAMAAKAGYTDLSEYVCFLIRNAKDREQDGLTAPDASNVFAAISELDELRIGNRLDGLSVRDLIDEGRRL